MRTIRASELALFVYCQRAWWYHVHGVLPEHTQELEAGLRYHHRHNIHISFWRWLRVIGFALLILAGMLYLTQ